MVRLAAVGVEAREEVEALAANVAAVRLQYKGIRTAAVVREAVEALPADKKEPVLIYVFEKEVM